MSKDPNESNIDQTVATIWSGNAPAWARALRHGRDEYRQLLLNPTFARFVGDVRGKRVLDAGCGEGDSSRILARNGARVTGIDIAPAMLELARGAERQDPLGIEYREASMADLSIFADETFDAVASTMAVMNSAHLDAEMREFFRVLRGGGFLALSVRHPCFATPAMQIVTDRASKKHRLLVGEYFRTEPWTERKPCETPHANARPDTFVAMRFPYTLSRYLNTMIGAGFAIAQIEEPRPEKRDCAARDWLAFWRENAALYLYLKGQKPATA